MMMLTAVILLAAFIALSATVGRLNSVGVETGRERSDPFAAEFASVQRGLDHIALRLDDPVLLGTRDYTDSFDAAARGLVAMEGSRGYALRVSPATCTLANDVAIAFQLQDAANYAQASWTLDLPNGNCA